MNAAVPVTISRAFLQPYDYEELSVGAVVVTLTAAKVAQANAVLVRFEAGPTVIRVDGVAPTPSVGWPFFDGDTEMFGYAEANQLRMIRQGATNGTVRARYYKW